MTAVVLCHPVLCCIGPFAEDADCMKIPCRGRGRCVHTTKGFICQCEAGFTGDTCEGLRGNSSALYVFSIMGPSDLGLD